jgi:hypothetical protein
MGGQLANPNPQRANLKPPWPKGVSGNPSGPRVRLREVRMMKLVRDKSSAGLRLSDPFVSENFKEGDTVRVTVERLKGKVQSVLNPADAV